MYPEEQQNYIDQVRQEPEWDGGKCPFCREMAWYFGGVFAECKECGKTHKDVEVSDDK